MNHLVHRIQESIRGAQYRISDHAELEREAEGILTREIEEALLSPQCEVLEDYPNDPRGHSALVLGFTSRGQPLHAVLGLGQEDIIAVITVYRPEPDEWINWRVRHRRP